MPEAVALTDTKLDPPGEYGRLVVTLYRYEADYEIRLKDDELVLAVPDPHGALAVAYLTFDLRDLEWWEDFKSWLREETAAVVAAGQQAFPPPPETGETSDEAYQKWTDARV
jgi:hypothetical protein